MVTAVEYEYLMVVKEEGEKGKEETEQFENFFFHLILLCTKDELPRLGVIQIIYFRGKKSVWKIKTTIITTLNFLLENLTI